MQDYKREHFQFVRQTKLPRAAFDTDSRINYWIGVLGVCGATILLVLAAMGAFL